MEMISIKRHTYIPYTEVIPKGIIKWLNPSFFPSLIQEEIEKEFEIRSFYIDGLFYSMAIFSQSDKLTKTDFRNYNYDKPNRCVPYLLPATVAHCLDSMMKDLQLNTGSIDLIKARNGRYYFLEVNPIGQFGMVSYTCNYYLEKVVARWLYNKNKT
jgi:ATP-GRASP peptide maturase of grasp-with-spasm system